jgi:hypothetical protein
MTLRGRQGPRTGGVGRGLPRRAIASRAGPIPAGHRAAGSVLLAAFVLFASLLLGVSGASGHAGGSILYGTGTATVDGALAPGEWAGARRIEFAARLPAHDGGGTVAATIRAMNDGSTLFVSLQVGRATYGGNTTLAMYFDNDHDGTREAGDDAFLADVGMFSPARFVDLHWASCVPGGPGLHCPVLDTERGGTGEGSSATGISGGTAVIEASHPLDSADDGHDFSLGPGSVAGYAAVVTLWSADTSCNFGEACAVHTTVPIGIPSHGETSGYGHLVASPDIIPPETSFADGLADGTTTKVRDASFVLSGADNLTAEEALGFSCSLDGAAFSECGRRPTFNSLGEGRHRLEARAADELGNVDPTPAVRHWTVDATPPETSITAGPIESSVTKQRDAIFVLAGTDNLTPAEQLVFVCSLDGRPFSKCEPRTVLGGLSDGQHRLQAFAADAAANVDQSPVSRQWRVDATPPSRPRVRVRVRGLVARVRLSAVDAAGGPVRYRCSLDGKRYRGCAASARFRLSRGPHILRAVALDAVLNRSAPRIARFRVPARRR